MTTVTVDDRKRVRIPSAKPGQVFAIENASDGAVTLTPVKADRKVKYPPGSLTKYFTGKLGKERDELESALLEGCVQRPE